MGTKHEKAHTEALKINEAKKLDPGSECEYALRAPQAGREAMTHEIVRSVVVLAGRLAKHRDSLQASGIERRTFETDVMVRVLHALPHDVLDMLNEKCDRLTVAQRDGYELRLLRPADKGSGFVWGTFKDGRLVTGQPALSTALDALSLSELISGLVAALAERIDNKHAAGKKLAQINRRLRGILSILDNS